MKMLNETWPNTDSCNKHFLVNRVFAIYQKLCANFQSTQSCLHWGNFYKFSNLDLAHYFTLTEASKKNTNPGVLQDVKLISADAHSKLARKAENISAVTNGMKQNWWSSVLSRVREVMYRVPATFSSGLLKDANQLESPEEAHRFPEIHHI